MFLPEKKSVAWIRLATISFIINLLALFGNHLILNTGLDLQSIAVIIIISLVLALLASLGYWNVKYFAVSFLIANLFAVFYLFFVACTQKGGGWADLTSLIGFLVYITAGIVAGLLLELIGRLIKWRKLKTKK